MPALRIILLVLACISFLLAAFKVPASVDWTPLGFALVTASLLA